MSVEDSALIGTSACRGTERQLTTARNSIRFLRGPSRHHQWHGVRTKGGGSCMADGLTAMTGTRLSESGPPPRLLDRVRTAVRLRHYSRRTEKAYVDWIRRYILFHQKKHPSTMGATEIVAFLSWLAVDKRVSASTQNQALNTVLFLYKQVLRLGPHPCQCYSPSHAASPAVAASRIRRSPRR